MTKQLEPTQPSQDWTYEEKLALSGDVNTPEGILAVLAEDKDLVVRINVAGNPNIPERLAKKLARTDSLSLLLALSVNPGVSESIVKKLVSSSNYKSKVREVVSANSNTPAEMLGYVFDKCGKRYDTLALMNLSVHPLTPEHVLKEIIKIDSLFRKGVVVNKSASEEILLELSQDRDGNIRGGVADNANTPLEVLEHLSKDSAEYVRIKVAGNPNTPLSVLESLLDESVTMEHHVKVNPSYMEHKRKETLEQLECDYLPDSFIDVIWEKKNKQHNNQSDD